MEGRRKARKLQTEVGRRSQLKKKLEEEEVRENEMGKRD